MPGKAEVTAIGGRDGFVLSSDSRLKLEMGAAEAHGRAAHAGTDPEQLFAAAYASCFLSALQQAGREAGVAIAPDANVTVRIEVEDAAPDQSPLGITLIVDLPGVDPAERQALVDRAHAISRCSRALRCPRAVRTIVD